MTTYAPTKLPRGWQDVLEVCNLYPLWLHMDKQQSLLPERCQSHEEARQEDERKQDKTVALVSAQHAKRQRARHGMTQLLQGDVQPTGQDSEPNGGC